MEIIFAKSKWEVWNEPVGEPREINVATKDIFKEKLKF